MSVNYERCTGCGLCVQVCKDFGLTLENGFATESTNSIFGCFACGHCMAICPNEAICIKGRFFEPDNIFEFDRSTQPANYQQLLRLFQQRRSIRQFEQREVEDEKVKKILEAAMTAPIGISPSDVNVLVFKSKSAVREFSSDYCQYLKKMRWLNSNLFLTLFRPLLGKELVLLFRSFFRPLVSKYINQMEKGENLITYNVPLAIYFYGSAYCDPADPLIAATYAMLAGEALGLGSCMLGAIHPLVQYGKRAKEFREKYGIKSTSREGIFVIFGYPSLKSQRGIRRTFASLTFR